MNEPVPSEVCVVVPSYKSRATIEAALRSLRSQEGCLPVDILVVDSSGDDTAAWLKERYPGVQVISSSTRLFPGAARNKDARHTSARLLAFLDADAAAEPDWLKLLVARLADRDVILASGAVANANPESISSRILYWIEFSEYLAGLPSGFRKALSSSNLLIRREDFIRSGGFEETYAMAEDLFFTTRLATGLFFENRAVVRHRHRSSWSSVKKHLDALGFWSGNYRREQATSGSFLARFPFLCAGLPLLRTPRIIRRVWRSSRKEGILAAALLPVLLVGLGYWAGGFYRGLTAGERVASPAPRP